MADTKISALAAVTTLGGTDEAVLAVSGASKKITGANLKTSITDASQPLDSELTALAGLTSAADKVPYFTGSGTAAVADFSSAGRALVDDADAAAQRTTLGLGSLATLSAVASAQITDGTIVNADVNASAAIAYSKLALGTSLVSGDLSAALSTSLQPWTVVTKSGDESVSSSTVLQNDDDLLFTAANGALYEIDVILLYGSPLSAGTPDIKVALGEDSTTRGAFIHNDFGTTDALRLVGYLAAQNLAEVGGTAAANRGLMMRGTYVGAGGTFRVLWAQNTSDGNATTVRAGSLLRYRRIV